MAKIKKENNEFIIIKEDGDKVGYIQYEEDKNTMTITHTIVEENERGKGYAGLLVKEAAEYARETGKKINPVCSYADEYLRRRQEYQDLLA
ncbi:GNAT family N-acetyltransferase [Bacillus massilinigeriensis]|uniref:GNAT family N-acetyltransferase n=1 Tax=Bacillus mediterraneensis TaxID=1805474 RepID=UPI001356669E|nr:GNAT family N-acetyltransferase [Bacillus mediterraneensis]